MHALRVQCGLHTLTHCSFSLSISNSTNEIQYINDAASKQKKSNVYNPFSGSDIQNKIYMLCAWNLPFVLTMLDTISMCLYVLNDKHTPAMVCFYSAVENFLAIFCPVFRVIKLREREKKQSTGWSRIARNLDYFCSKYLQ